MRRFVVGFAFSAVNTKLLLIRKNKPEFLKGKLNGPGGAIEDGETPHDAMVREFEEETGIKNTMWDMFCKLSIPKEQSQYHEEVEIYFFGTHTDDIWKAYSRTDEKVELIAVISLSAHSDLVDNLHWLIPMYLKDKETYSVTEKRELYES